MGHLVAPTRTARRVLGRSVLVVRCSESLSMVRVGRTGSSVRIETVVLRPVVEPHMHPRNTSTSRAQPYRFLSNAPIHCGTDCVPERTLLPHRCPANESSKVTVAGQIANRTGDDQDRIATEIRKHYCAAIHCAWEVFGERLQVRGPREVGAVQEDEFKMPIQRGAGDRRRFPTKGGERRFGEHVGEQ